MTENPYQSPKTNATESENFKHRSFHLTAGSSSPDANVALGTFSNAIVFTLIQQLPLLLMASLILDNGLFFQHVAIASTVFWLLTLLIMLRQWRQRRLSDSAILLVKWGYLPIITITLLGVLPLAERLSR